MKCISIVVFPSCYSCHGCVVFLVSSQACMLAQVTGGLVSILFLSVKSWIGPMHCVSIDLLATCNCKIWPTQTNSLARASFIIGIIGWPVGAIHLTVYPPRTYKVWPDSMNACHAYRYLTYYYRSRRYDGRHIWKDTPVIEEMDSVAIRY